MCTAISFSRTHHYFGRNLDLEYHYDEQVVITPRRFPFIFRRMPPMPQHFAMIGMATAVSGYPLYYEATNEFGLSMAGLNFPGSAHYFPMQEGKDNVTPFEFIPWVLGQCRNMDDVRGLLSHISLLDEPFSVQLPLTPLHWMISFRSETLVAESTADGLHVYDNPVHVMTNNPPFPMQLWNLSNYMALSPEQPENRLAPSIPLHAVSNGMGAMGLPGDWSSVSRFVRATYVLHHAQCEDAEDACVAQFFRMLDAVAMPCGSVLVHGKPEITVYSCCCNADTGMYYYTTYENRAITAVDMHGAALDSAALVCCPLDTAPAIRRL